MGGWEPKRRPVAHGSARRRRHQGDLRARPPRFTRRSNKRRASQAVRSTMFACGAKKRGKPRLEAAPASPPDTYAVRRIGRAQGEPSYIAPTGLPYTPAAPGGGPRRAAPSGHDGAPAPERTGDPPTSPAWRACAPRNMTCKGNHDIPRRSAVRGHFVLPTRMPTHARTEHIDRRTCAPTPLPRYTPGRFSVVAREKQTWHRARPMLGPLGKSVHAPKPALVHWPSCARSTPAARRCSLLYFSLMCWVLIICN